MISLFFILLLSVQLFASEPIIKSLHVYTNKSKINLPVLNIHSSDKLIIEFDIEEEHEPNLSIFFKFCDADWKPYDNLLLEGISDIVQYNVQVNRLPITTEGAEYHVKQSFPNRNVKFNNSGKWMFFITDNFDEDIVYEWGKFYVVDNMIKLKTSIQNWRKEGSISSNNAADRVLNFKTRFSLPDSLEGYRVEHIEIIKNLEISYPIIITKDSFQKNKGFEWDGTKNFEFVARDIEPGNEYRQVDIRDKDKYEYPFTRAHFDGIEYSRFYKLGRKDFNGGFKLMSSRNQYADYLVTTFEFKPHKKIYDDIFIVGAFTNWEVLPWFKLKEKDELYTISIELKRGIYDYQYVTGSENNEKVSDINWEIFEGNFWETRNLYSVFLYYKDPANGEFDKIIGYRQFVR